MKPPYNLFNYLKQTNKKEMLKGYFYYWIQITTIWKLFLKNVL